jgi:hypothetical protein
LRVAFHLCQEFDDFLTVREDMDLRIDARQRFPNQEDVCRAVLGD